MSLFILIAIICLILTVGPDLLKQLKLSRLLTSSANTIPAELQQELNAAQAELERVRTDPSTGEYARTIKTLRAEQKIKDLQQKINVTRNIAHLKSQSIDVVASYALKFLLSLTLIIISFIYRSTPVVVFDKSMNFQPFTGLMSFPTGVHNAVSVHIWTVSCNVSLRIMYNLIRCRE